MVIHLGSLQLTWHAKSPVTLASLRHDAGWPISTNASNMPCTPVLASKPSLPSPPAAIGHWAAPHCSPIANHCRRNFLATVPAASPWT